MLRESVVFFLWTRVDRPTFMLCHQHHHHAGRNTAVASQCNELVLRFMGNFYFSIHHVSGHVGDAGNECADIAVSFGMHGIIFECNASFFWLDIPFSFETFPMLPFAHPALPKACIAFSRGRSFFLSLSCRLLNSFFCGHSKFLLIRPMTASRAMIDNHTGSLRTSRILSDPMKLWVVP